MPQSGIGTSKAVHGMLPQNGIYALSHESARDLRVSGDREKEVIPIPADTRILLGRDSEASQRDPTRPRLGITTAKVSRKQAELTCMGSGGGLNLKSTGMNKT